MRLFVAVDLPETVRGQLARGLARLRRELPSARWVRPEGVHITLKFLGEQPDELPERLSQAVEGGLGRLTPVEVAPGGAGFFPHERRPRVAWLGGRAEGLVEWAETVDQAATSLGLEPERRPFSLHLTLARLQRPWPPNAIRCFFDEVSSWHLESFSAREMTLFRSELQPGGAVYTAVRRWRVGKEGRDAS